MKRLIALLLISSLLIVGCAEKTAEPGKTPVENEPSARPSTTPTPELSGGNVDTGMQDDLAQLASDMAEVESLMNDLQQLQNVSFDL